MSDGVIVQLANGDVAVNFGADGAVSGAGALTIANRLTKVTATGTIGMATVAESAGALTGVTTLTASGAGSFVGLSSSSGLTVSSGTSALQAITCTTLTASGAISGLSVTAVDPASAAYLSADGAVGSAKGFRFLSSGSLRWVWQSEGAESGADAGATMVLYARTDAGGPIDTPLSIVRAAGGAITLTRPLTISSTTASTSTTTGCATFAGGIGVAGSGYFGGNLSADGGAILLGGKATFNVYSGTTAAVGGIANSGWTILEFWTNTGGGTATKRGQFDDAGLFTCYAGVTCAAVSVGANQVVGAQGAAVADATGAGDVVAQLNTLLARLRTHGLIAT